jgi:Bacterial Ig-like domain
MRRLPLAALLVTCCAFALAPGCGDEESKPPSSPDAGPRPDGGTDGGLPDAGPSDTTAPTVISASPAEGATGVYPVEVYYRTTAPAGLSERKVITFQFSEPMDTSILQATLHDLTDTTVPTRTLSGAWSDDGQTLTLTALQPEEGGPVLNENTAYAVGLTGHKDIAGNALDAAHPGLGDGRLDFETGASDSLLNHACGHTLVDSITAVTASSSPTGTLPRTDQTHKHYEVTLPASGEAYAGHTRMLLAPETGYVLFLDQAIPVGLHDVAGDAPVDATSEPAPPACSGITHRLRFTSPLDPEVRASFSGRSTKLRFILEESF